MIITLVDTEINIKNGKIIFPEENSETQYEFNKLQNTYKININNFDYELVCPQVITDTNEISILWPSFKLPRRKYPVYVYIYAVALYLNTNKSMRKVAEEVRKKFGLEKFSHSTLSRCLKKLKENLETLTELALVNSENKELFKRKQWDENRTKQYRTLLEIISPILQNSKTTQFGSSLNFKFFEKTKKFPI